MEKIKFEKTKSIDKATRARVTKYTWGSFNVVATPTGISFSGFSDEIQRTTDLQQFAYITSLAWKEHLRIMPKGDVIPPPVDDTIKVPPKGVIAGQEEANG